MARSETRYVCGTCGAASVRWEGQCRGCGNWNTLVESVVAKGPTNRARRTATAAPPTTALADVQAGEASRVALGIREVDRVLGGGIVPGSLILLGGEPGIGKSTLVLSVAAAVAAGDPSAR